MFSKSTKQMLRNVIRHTGTHNRMVEETDMWTQRSLKRDSHGKASRNSFLFDQRSDNYDDRRRRGHRTAHMDSGDSDEDKQKSTYWSRQLQKAEETNPDRWGHSGFKELYPDDFASDRSEGEEKRSRKKKKKKEKKRKKKKKEKKHKSKHHSDSDSERERDDHMDRPSFRTKSANSLNTRDRVSDRNYQDHRIQEREPRKRKYSSSDSSASSSFEPVRKEGKREKDSFRENGDHYSSSSESSESNTFRQPIRKELKSRRHGLRENHNHRHSDRKKRKKHKS
ncbi:uncharacterized protein NKAPD1-like [Haliotis rufescens]|uniref:uncharacterized protein NKAPD1-like n=1 Tax=Haliotis rufescens TaxID=6454 RepID=UPI001EAF9908|nr:uncharacterized protein NKAPD1-like [Haliotis rufescens]